MWTFEKIYLLVRVNLSSKNTKNYNFLKANELAPPPPPLPEFEDSPNAMAIKDAQSQLREVSEEVKLQWWKQNEHSIKEFHFSSRLVTFQFCEEEPPT